MASDAKIHAALYKLPQQKRLQVESSRAMVRLRLKALGC